jgi:Na(+)-translocating NADH:ubiquinone oxidoreductase A subunit
LLRIHCNAVRSEENVRLRHGGFTPRVAGRPGDGVEQVSLPGTLRIDLSRGGITYTPVVGPGQEVAFGAPLAEASAAGGTLTLPAPASGMVKAGGTGQEILLENLSFGERAQGFQPLDLGRAAAGAIKETLARAGIWPFFWSSRSRGMPRLDAPEGPRAIIVNCILTEPFRARGKVVIERSWNRIVTGIRFLQRLVAAYGRIEIVLTSPHHPVARRIYADLSGYAWARVHPAPLVYPIENPRVLSRALRRDAPGLKPQDEIWVIDVQGVEAIGSCLSEGLPLHRRLVALGGPGLAGSGPRAPRHLEVRIGTPIRSFLEPGGSETRLLRGGLLTGRPLDAGRAAVGYDDDALFALAEVGPRESLSFLRAGFTRASYSRTFVSRLTGAADSHISTSLRGERRPCIACGLCEDVCPAEIMPQVLHRYLYAEALDQAERAGLDRCVDCNLCTYVCPSKIDLQKQFAEARQQIKREREEASGAALAAGTEDAGEMRT